MTTDLESATAGDDQVAAALHELADAWVADSSVPPYLYARRARSAWRRKVAVVATTSTLAVAGAVAIGVAVVPSMRAAVRPTTISASNPPANPPEYDGYAAVSLGIITHTAHGAFTVPADGGLPTGVPVVNARGFIGLTDAASGPSASFVGVREPDAYSAGGETDPGFGVTIDGVRFQGDVSGRGPGKPLILSWFQPSSPLAVGQIVHAAGRVPFGRVTRLLPSVYPDKHDARAEVQPFADLEHPGQVWALRKPGDVPSASTAAPVVAPTQQQLSPTHHLLTVGPYSLGDFSSVDPTNGKLQTCLTLTTATGGQGPDCRTAAKLGRDSLAVDVGGSFVAGPNPIVIAGRAGTSVARVVIVLDDGSRVEAKVAPGGSAYAGNYFAATWAGKVPADKALAYDASGRSVGETTTYYGAGGGF